MRYTNQPRKRRWPRRLLWLALIAGALLALATFTVRQVYFEKLEPVASTSQETKLITIEQGASVDEIARQLEEAGLIQSAWAFKLYVGSKEVRADLQAGTYSLDASQSVPEIVAQLTRGKVATDLVTILPGQRLDQIRSTLINDGFNAADVDAALDPSAHEDSPVLVDKPKGNNLEGYLYPDSFQKISGTSASTIIRSSLTEMGKYLTPDLRSDFAKQGLSVYQAIILASIVEQEASNQSDREQVAQVYQKRLKIGMKLQADPTAFYGARLDDAPRSLSYDSPYNTYLYGGLPPGPISNVSASSLMAVARPANTEWLYFVAGDDGNTHFSKTLAEHEAAIEQYCTGTCGDGR